MVPGHAVRHHLRSPRSRRRLIALVGTFALTPLPLVGTLSYENAFVLSPVAALLGIAVGVDAVRQLRDARGAGPVPLRRALRLALPELAVLGAITLTVLLIGRLWQRGCDPLGGLLFFAMGPALSSLLGLVAGLWGGALATRRWAQLLIGFAPMGLSLAIGLWRLYADPVVYAYDPFWGYFSGSVYDESVSVGATYRAFRLYNVAAGVAAALGWHLLVDPVALRPRRPRLRRHNALVWVATVGLALGAAAVGLRGAKYRFTANYDSITEVLSATRETEHFVIHYAPRSADARSIDAIVTEHEFAWHRLRDAMGGRAPEGTITSFVFQNRDQKRKLMGAGTVQVAAPWRKQIYLDHRPFPHPVLHHELAHIFGKTVGDRTFGVSMSGTKLNIGLIEGLATALAPRPANRLDLHDQATVLQRLGLRPPLAAIMGPGFLTKSSRVAYTAAGSFCAWLIATHGFEPMAVLYGSAGDFQRAYQTPLAQLEKQWLAFLDAREGVRPEDVDALAQRFKRPSVFQRPCAHKVAEVRVDIGRARGRGRFDEAVEGHRKLCALEPKRAQHRVGLASGLAVAGEYDQASQELADAETTLEMTVTIRGALLEKRGDVELVRGKLPAAIAAYDEALALPVGEGKHRVLTLKRLAAKDASMTDLVVDYFAPFDVRDDGVTRAVARVHLAATIARRPGYEALGNYLVGRQLLNIQRPADAVAALERALAKIDELPTPEFVRATRRALVSATLRTGAFDRARAVLAELAAEPGIGNGHRLDYAYWRQRIEFFANYAATVPW